VFSSKYGFCCCDVVPELMEALARCVLSLRRLRANAPSYTPDGGGSPVTTSPILEVVVSHSR
jgi:hypothetical protein